jgi:hypothetical protein
MSSAPGQPIEIVLGACGNYGDRPNQLVDMLNKLVKDQSIEGVEFKLNILGIIDLVLAIPTATPDATFQLQPMKPRVQMLLGLYDIAPTKLVCQTYDATHKVIQFPNAPMLCFGNVLYLISNNNNVVGVNDSTNGEYRLSIAYKYGELIIPTCPMVSKKPGYWITCRAEDLAKVEFQLVDWQFRKVKILNPVHVSIELEFINSPLDLSS